MPRRLLAIAAIVAIGCGTMSTTPEPNDAAWTQPADWTVVTNDRHTVELTLPPWLEVFATAGAVSAHEPPPAPDVLPIQVFAAAPDPHALREFGDVAGWIRMRIDPLAYWNDTTKPGLGAAELIEVHLPAGEGVRLTRIDNEGTRMAWRLLAYAIETLTGVAYLQIDGPLDAWLARADDLEHVVMLFRAR